jgi:FkbM family methyltransferase
MNGIQPELENLLSETMAQARTRAQTAFDRLAEPVQDSLVLFGAGRLGRKTALGLTEMGLHPLAFADNNPALWGQTVEAVPVLSPQEAVARHANNAVFVITIWGAGSAHRQAHSRQQLLSLGCPRVASFGLLFWKYADIFLPYYGLDLPYRVLEQAEAVRTAFDLWADDASRQEFLAQLRWRLTLDFDGLPSPATHPQYFAPDLFRQTGQEQFVDCGAFTGDTIAQFLAGWGGSFEKIVALEPDPTNFRKLMAYIAAQPPETRAKIRALPVAAGVRRETAYFQAMGAPSSAIAANGSLPVECMPLDEILKDDAPTFIKMDIEGAEPAALLGSRRVFETQRPVLAVSAYHRQDHLWQIPLLIRSMVEDYHYFLRPHNEEGWDLICYAVPVERLKQQGDKNGHH